MKRIVNLILVIDDDRTMADYHQTLLEKSEAPPNRIAKFYSVDESLEYLNQNQEDPENLPDIILLDLHLPGLDAWDFIDKYKKLSINRTNPPYLYIISSYFSPEEREQIEKEDMIKGSFIKPLTVQQISDLLNINGE